MQKKPCSPMSSSAFSDLNSKGDLLKMHDHCSNRQRKCQKQNNFTPKQFQLEGASFKKQWKKISIDWKNVDWFFKTWIING